MVSILINAYACSPNMGSEPGMAWNWCMNLAKYCELHIITEGEFRDEIERVVPILPQGKNMHFYYNPLSDEVRKMCWNQGDWRFYIHYKKWQKSTCKIAKNICKEHHIDILHQLNMIGFREPGYLWSIEDKPFVWGPIGGMDLMPMDFLSSAPKKQKLFSAIKNIVNDYQRKHSSRVIKALNRASMLVAATKGAYDLIHDYHNKDVVLINETGCAINTIATTNHNFHKEGIELVWAGKFDFRKQLALAIRIVANLKVLPIHLNIVGTGNDTDVEMYKSLASQLRVEDKITWHGLIPNTEVKIIMRNADVFLFTSIMEATSTVVLEALESQLPVVCFDTCGFGPLIDSTVGLKVDITTPSNAINDFAEKITYLYEHRDVLEVMSQNCKQRSEELSWDNKALQLVALYEKSIQEYRNV